MRTIDDNEYLLIPSGVVNLAISLGNDNPLRFLAAAVAYSIIGKVPDSFDFTEEENDLWPIAKQLIDFEKRIQSLEKTQVKEDRTEWLANPEMFDPIELDASSFRTLFSLSDEEQEILKDRLVGLDYNSFLKTPYWRIVACIVKAKAKMKCQECFSSNALEVHHLSYKNHGDELNHLEDLVCLCHKCHSKAHGNEE